MGGTYTLSGGTLTINNGAEYVGYNAAGFFTQTGGTNTPRSGIALGTNAGSNGTYTLSGGMIESGGIENIGVSGTGTFNQTGGVNGVYSGQAILLGYNAGATGTYNLSGTGILFSTHDIYIGYGGTGIFNQSGGTHYVTNDDYLVVGYGGGTTGTYNLSGGVLNATGTTTIGVDGTGTVSQTGGTSTFTAATGVRIASNAGSTGTYTLSGGSAAVSSNVYVGGSSEGPGGTGTLNVSGTGVLTVGGTLTVFNTGHASVNLSGGTINAAALYVDGNPSLLNWTSGTLNMTQSVIWDPTDLETTSEAFGASRTLGANQTLMVSANETLGGAGAFALTLNSGSTHSVAGGITLSPTGTITQNAGSTLYAASFTQAGGTVNGTLQNQGAFVHQSGLFNGRLLNQGTVSWGSSFTAGNGIENDAAMTVAVGQTLTANGAGLDNIGSFTLAGGVLSGSGPVLNNFGGTLQGYGTINPTFTNNGVVDVNGVLRLNGVTATNNGIIRGGGTVIGAFANAAGGTVDLAVGKTLAINNAWTNSGLVTLAGGAVLGGGTITNTGTIQGAGAVQSTIANFGVVRASGGELDLAGAGSTNSTAGLIQAATADTVMILQGLAANAGTIALTGGAFDNNNHALANSGIINGYGTLRTGGLTNTNKLNVGEGNLDVFGSVNNNGTIGIQGGRSIYFFNDVSGSGTYTGAGTAIFLAAVSPGNSPAVVSFGGNADFSATSTLEIELGGTALGTYDQISVMGKLSLGGALDVSILPSLTPAAGQSFDILDWGTLDGEFYDVNLPTLAGLSWDTSQLYESGELSLVAAGLLGDYNNNGVVDAADYTVWRDAVTASNTSLLNDPTPGMVSGSDFTYWREHFGESLGSGAGLGVAHSPATVPEPASLALSLIAGATLLVRVRRGC